MAVRAAQQDSRLNRAMHGFGPPDPVKRAIHKIRSEHSWRMEENGLNFGEIISKNKKVLREAKPLERSRQTARDQAEAPTLPTLILGNTQPLRKLAQFAASIVPSEHYSGVARIAELEGLPITTPVVDTQAPGRLVAEAQREDGELAAKRQRTGFIERPLKDSTAAVQFQRGPRCR
ncbi:hypothetical protein CLAFUW4_07216 [Fulvia fulva]|uniref:Uncharacterized protein n=1 Tax=Passalora fulva TaxID=5499 RepID=A0A9Q8UR50_PASFU|nr:uncharacterized protein CLAFUR5_07349 [Fulvia fulva]KAK4621557.1 hypothetical protein CLAFUR4_07224 [Fulvia fulva]KAK4623190.1 hypothetical protein CLAFUR0_07221 [Fulvia fulva]UJO19434.1 hypothetical protein CLAFUR5_07349 [Fulvia fulva]WPV16355.1 hypothetical protein CLAFUW4_07216 [Fulvia fulva]WPV30650.1 hypothetical protein CLAFUW7_07217 [Fulvia fulva]